jgi:hypothetical protein
MEVKTNGKLLCLRVRYENKRCNAFLKIKHYRVVIQFVFRLISVQVYKDS